MRMTAFPARSCRATTVMPRMATNPSGSRKIGSVATIPISPIGTTLNTRNRRLKLCKLHHQHGHSDEQHQRNNRKNRSLRFRALLDRAAHRNVVGISVGWPAALQPQGQARKRRPRATGLLVLCQIRRSHRFSHIQLRHARFGWGKSHLTFDWWRAPRRGSRFRYPS